MGKYKVTVIIPAYNSEQFIRGAIESVPDRPDVETIVVNDGSTDQTAVISSSYAKVHLINHETNKGVAAAVNTGLDNAKGEYVVLLGSDDYLCTAPFEKLIDELDGTDLVYFDLRTNDGSIFQLTPETKLSYCGSTKFMRKAFIDSVRNDEAKKAGEDWFFYQELLKKNPTEKFTGVVAKHYNYPREGSLSWQLQNGIIEKGE